MIGGADIDGTVEEVSDLIANGEEARASPADLKRFMIRSRRRVGW
jgi:hypothetical protein